MQRIRSLQEGSAYIGSLPTGCTLCGPGKKMVLLITGRCNSRCFYCPLSFAKRHKNVIYANELKVHELDEIVGEAKAISAGGTGITGGDPMVVPELTIGAISLLKETFSTKHHIHLYTAGDFEPKYIAKLSRAGLDEIRFHPPFDTWGKVNKKLEKLLELANSFNLEVGAELPMLPGFEKVIIRFAKYLESHGGKFLNLNELEFSETNWQNCHSHGYVQKDPLSNSVLGSETSALKILHELAAVDGLKLNVHYCSAKFKDRQQLANRLKRRAKNVIRPFEVLTEEGTFLLGVIEFENSNRRKDNIQIQHELVRKYGVPDKLLSYNDKLNRLEVASWVLQELKNELQDEVLQSCYIVEEYPTADRLEVERIPLKDF